MRTFDTGATRDTINKKLQLSGYLSPLVLKRFGQYMLRHQQLPDGTQRASDNWKRGIPKDVYLDSLIRHVLDIWLEHEGAPSRDGVEEALMGALFNIQGYAHEHLKGTQKPQQKPQVTHREYERDYDPETGAVREERLLTARRSVERALRYGWSGSWADVP